MPTEFALMPGLVAGMSTVTVDTVDMGVQWRRHSIGCMGEDPVITPHFDQFAFQGVLFENAFSCSPICTPNRAAMLTGKHPFSMNMMHNWLRLPFEEEMIAKAAKRGVYATGFIGKWHLDAYEPGDIGNQWSNMTPRWPRRMGFDYWLAKNCLHDHFTYESMDTEEQIVKGEGWMVDYETDAAIRYIENENGAARDSPRCQGPNVTGVTYQHGEKPYENILFTEDCEAGLMKIGGKYVTWTTMRSAGWPLSRQDAHFFLRWQWQVLSG